MTHSTITSKCQTTVPASERRALDLEAGDSVVIRRPSRRRAMKQKLENLATSYIEAIAKKRGRNVEWAKAEVKFVLMLIALCGIIGELSNPGAILPGVIGTIALVPALYMGSILPVTLAGVALLVLAAALFITDIFTPSHGILTAGGIVAFFLGSLMLFDSPLPAFRLPLIYIISSRCRSNCSARISRTPAPRTTQPPEGRSLPTSRSFEGSDWKQGPVNAEGD